MDDPLSAVDADVGRHLFDKLVVMPHFAHLNSGPLLFCEYARKINWTLFFPKFYYIICGEVVFRKNLSVLIGSFLFRILPYNFLFSKDGKFKPSMAQVPHTKLLTNLACSSHTGEYLPSVTFCTDLAALGHYCHDLRLIFPSLTLLLG